MVGDIGLEPMTPCLYVPREYKLVTRKRYRYNSNKSYSD
nr:MAG TPA: hypothetical protein [Caudoviricetes sp.]